MLKKITLLATLCGVCPLLCGQTGRGNPFSFEGSYVGDSYYNAAGGLQTGGGFMGMGNIKVGFDTGKAGLWSGGSFFINGASIHGRSLSGNYLGDLQIASNIDAGEHVYLHELWFRQELGSVSFTVGLQDLNAEFMASGNAGEFINSSFGVPPVIACNVPVPIFPLTGLGAAVHWNIDDRFVWQTAVFDGCQTPFEHNPHNIRWDFREDDGMLAMTEIHFNTATGTYKLGGYYHSGLREFDEGAQAKNTIFEHNYGVYLLGDQTVFEQGNHRLDIFAQAAIAPKSKNGCNYYIGLGANLFGVFSRQQKDAIGLAVAHAGLHDVSHKHETAVELYYKYRFNDNLALQPEVQYIINPSGGNEALKNALVGILRLYINF